MQIFWDISFEPQTEMCRKAWVLTSLELASLSQPPHTLHSTLHLLHNLYLPWTNKNIALSADNVRDALRPNRQVGFGMNLLCILRRDRDSETADQHCPTPVFWCAHEELSK